MENKGKRNRMRFFASCLAVVMCLSMVDTSLFFPVSAEGETTPVEQTPEIAQPEETSPEGGTEPGAEMPEPDVPVVEEESKENVAPDTTGEGVSPVQPEEPKPEGEENSSGPEEESAPETMTVQSLQAARTGEKYLNFQVKDTDGAVVGTSKVRLGLGWVRDSQTIPLDLQENGKHYSFKEVKVNDQTVVYTAEYNGQIYYSSNGVTAQKLPEEASFDVIYWEYFEVKFDKTSSLDGVNPENMAVVKADSQTLKYPDDPDKSLTLVLAKLHDSVANGEKLHIYKGQVMDWNLIPLTTDAGSKYVVLSSQKNDESLDNALYKNGGNYTELITQDTTFSLLLGNNEKIEVSFDSPSVAKTTINPLGYDTNTSQIQFSVTTRKENKTNGDTFDVIQLRILREDGEFEFIKLDVPDSDTTKTTQVSGFEIIISRTSEYVDSNIFIPKYSYTYDFTVKRIDGNPIYNDLYFIGVGQSNAISHLDVDFDSHIRMAKPNNNESVVEIVSGKSHTLNVSHSTETFYVAGKTGYTIDVPTLTRQGSFLGSINFVGDKLQTIPVNGSVYDKDALSKGFTHLIKVQKNWLYANYKLSVSSIAIPTIIRFISENGELFGEELHGTIDENNGPIKLPKLEDTEEKDFIGWILNKKSGQIFSANDQFIISESTWSLGMDENEGASFVRVFEFSPLFVDKDAVYTVEHYLQRDDGSWPGGTDDPISTVRSSSPDVQNDYIIGLPKQFEGYHLDEAKTDAEGFRGLHIVNGKPVDESGKLIENAVIRLYYAKDIQYGNLSIYNHVSGDLANKNKPFSYQLIAEPRSANFPVDKLLEADFKVDSTGSQYVKSVNLKHGDSYSMQNLPITNCEYTVTLTTDDTFYTTTKAVKVNDADVESDENNKSHVFEANTMTPGANHEVHFTHIASDVVPAGNIFEDKGFDLMLATTAVLGLLCAVYAVFRRRMQIR